MERRPGSPTSTGAPPTADPAEEQWETTAPPESGPSLAPQRREGGREAGLRLPLLLRPGPGAGPMAGAAEGRVRLEWPAPGVARLVLDRPAALNALSKPMFAELAAHFRALRAREDVAAAILTGAGDRAFSAGVDLKAAAAVFRSAEGDASAELDVVAEMERCPFPIVGAVNGLAITAGFELALACDVLLCSATAFFQDTHCRYGIVSSNLLLPRRSARRRLFRWRARTLTPPATAPDAVVGPLAEAAEVAGAATGALFELGLRADQRQGSAGVGTGVTGRCRPRGARPGGAGGRDAHPGQPPGGRPGVQEGGTVAMVRAEVVVF